jgi:LacI family transcriptional regulator
MQRIIRTDFYEIDNLLVLSGINMTKYFKVALLINPSRKYTQGILSGIARYSRFRGTWNFYRPLDYREKKAKTNLLQIMKDLKPDGVLMREPPGMDKIIMMNIPAVTFPYSQETFSKIANAVVDHVAVGEMAAKHFIDRGFSHFAYIGFEDWWWSLKRKEGFQKTLQQTGYEILAYSSATKKKLKWSDELPQIADWIRSLPKPIAVMACNDDRGELVIEACKIANVPVPEEVSVIGVDNDQLVCDLCNPPLSSISLSLEKSGYEAAKLLDQLMSKKLESPHNIFIIPTHVATRRSTDTLAIDDKEVAAALRFIKNNIKKNLCVSDVVDNVALSRRVLEKRFRTLLNKSIHVEIKQNRIKLMEQMLYDNTMSIMEIAHELNFDDVTHFSRYFHNEKGLSPSKYRKKFCLFNSFHHD